jgi:hypothetical protein
VKQQQRLTQLFEDLDSDSRTSLLDFAEFLHGKAHANSSIEQVEEKAEPLLQPRPQEETVINAIKRLKAGYFMLDTDPLLNETSALMTQFMLQGRSANEVIDDLEQLFEEHYRKYLET